jgi:hypothetical protein
MPDHSTLRSRILETVNMIVTLEGGPVQVADVRIVSAPAFFDSTYGTSILTDDGNVVLRVAVQRPPDQVADTVLHELAHVLLGPEHIDQPDHGAQFQSIYAGLKGKYTDVVMEQLKGL